MLAIVVAYLISIQITVPIKQLGSPATQVENGNLDVIPSTDRCDELGTLSNSLSSLIARMRDLIEKHYSDQLEKEQMKLKVLQNQINPHFLYNTLNIIYWTARLESVSKTSEITDALSQFYKLDLNWGNEITTVKKGIQHLNSYITIQKMRYDYELNIGIELDPSLYSCKIIKLILQPIVVNALLHGIATLGEKGRIRITGNGAGEDILFTVEDNGVGIPDDVAKVISEGTFTPRKGFGLRNVNERIKLITARNTAFPSLPGLTREQGWISGFEKIPGKCFQGI